MNPFTVLFFGDVVGRPGRMGLRSKLQELRTRFKANMVVVNGENASGGVGLDPESAKEIYAAGADVITLGDHTWKFPDIKKYLDDNSNSCIRPANYPKGAPGRGWAKWRSGEGPTVGVINVMGRVFIEIPLECPFQAVEDILAGPLADCKVVLLDVHAEATSEKIAMSRVFDGKVSLIVGTHTHVQTSDEKVLPGGTAYITDMGMCGPDGGVIGMDTEVALYRFRTGMPQGYRVGKGETVLCGVACTIDPVSGRALTIERIREYLGEGEGGHR